MANKLWNTFNSSENKYIIYCGIFAVVYFFFALPFLIDKVGNNVMMQFLVFDLGIIILLNIYLKSKSLNSKIDFIKSLEYMCVVLAIAILIPPYHVSPQTGQIEGGAILGTASVDYFFATIGMQYLNLSGIWVSIWTFVVVPTGLLYIAKVVSKSNFVKVI